MEKFIFIDIDGTLLNSSHKISKQTLLALQQINHDKISVILISARPPQAITPIYKELGLTTPIVSFNGALILEKNKADVFTILHSSEVTRDNRSIVDSVLPGTNGSVSYYRQWEWYTADYDHWIKQEEKITGIKATLINDESIAESGLHKILFMANPPEIEQIEQQLKKAVGDQLNIYRSKETYLEITSNNASKKNALQFMLRKYGMKREEIIAIGDNYNDIEMLQFAGTSIAMGNAPDEIKARATFVTLDNDSDGIKYALEKLIEKSIY